MIAHSASWGQAPRPGRYWVQRFPVRYPAPYTVPFFSFKHQSSTGILQIQDLEASKQAAADQLLMNEQQNQYLQQQLDLAQMQVTCSSFHCI